MERNFILKNKKLSGAAGVDTMIILLIGMIVFGCLYQLFSYYSVVFMVKDSFDAAVISAASMNYENQEVYKALRENNFSSLNENMVNLSDIKDNLVSDLNLSERGNKLVKEENGRVYYTINIEDADAVSCEVKNSTVVYSITAALEISVNLFGSEKSLETPLSAKAKYDFKN